MRALLAGLVLLAPLVPVAAATPASGVRAAEEDSATPLTVRLLRLAPAAIPRRGALTLAGTVVNDSEETWSAINVHPFISAVPMTTREELAVAAASEADAEVGRRITTPGQFAPIGDLGPGEATRFVIRIPVADLEISGADGVYWIGVHALGSNAEGRDELADGRARSFIPLVRDATTTSVSLVVPVRERVRRDRSGRVLDPTGWAQNLGENGRLGRIVDLLGTAGDAPATLLADPAVLEAVEALAADNPEISLGEAPPDEEPGEEPSDEPNDEPSGNTTSRAVDRLDADQKADAAAWLESLISFASAHPVLGLAYADPDTAALARRKPAMLARAERLAAATFGRLGIAATPAVAPPGGWLDDDALPAIAQDSLVLVSDHAAPRNRTQWRTGTEQDLVFTDERASDGGPGPTEAFDALAVRQRILADAALRPAEGGSSTMVVELPPSWDPGPGWEAARFFEGLDQPWLQLTGLRRSFDPTTPVFQGALGYPTDERAKEIGGANIAAARQLVITGATFNQMLRSTNAVDHRASGAALTAVSYWARRDPDVAAAQVLVTDSGLRDRLAAVEVIGTDFVTLSGGSGTVAVTLVNGLEQPVTVGVEATTVGDGVRIRTPGQLEMAPGEQAVLRLRAQASAIGVHEVSLTPVTAGGLDLGTPLTFSIRTSEVGTLIWIVLGAGALLLVVMIGRRIVRGVREHRWRGQ